MSEIAYPWRAKKVIPTSKEENSPLLKRISIMKSPRKKAAKKHPNPIKNKTLKILKLWELICFISFCIKSSVKFGKETSATATPNRPRGNWISLSDKYNQVGLPVIKNEANIVSTKTFNW